MRLDKKLKLWTRTLEAKFFSFSRSKIEYTKYDFSATMRDEGDIRLDGHMVSKKDTFHYMGSMLRKDWRY
jgi:hypothetical protein